MIVFIIIEVDAIPLNVYRAHIVVMASRLNETRLDIRFWSAKKIAVTMHGRFDLIQLIRVLSQ